ncbi:MAG: alpha/beta hydrolase, partial [Actinomycetia bacterium]|nr:alpha/beta hydrolase [Actinomycetes bacterium]
MTDDMSPEVTVEQLTLITSDGVELRAELAAPNPIRAAMVVCHPHPLYGGSMEANVVEALFRSLPGNEIGILRFNFRGGGGSGGSHDNGTGEQLDVRAATEAALVRWPDVPLTLAGYSFGADVALAVDHDQVQGWFGVAPPLRILAGSDLVALADERPKHLVAAAHDQFRSPAELAELVADAPNTTVTTVNGA